LLYEFNENAMKPVFKIKKDKNPTVATLIVKGELGATNGKAFKESLVNWLHEDGELELSLHSVEAIDTLALQLIYSVRKAAALAGRKIKIVLPEHKGVLELLKKTGLSNILLNEK